MTDKPSGVLRAGKVIDKFVTESEELGRIHVLALSPDSENLGDNRLGKAVSNTVSYQEVDPAQFRAAELGGLWPDKASAKDAALAAEKNHPLLQRIYRNSLPQEIPAEIAWSITSTLFCLTLVAAVCFTITQLVIPAFTDADRGVQPVDSGLIIDKDSYDAIDGKIYKIRVKDCSDDEAKRCRTGTVELDKQLYDAVSVGDQYPEAAEKKFGKRHKERN